MALGRGTADALFFKRYGIDYLPVMYIIVSVTLCLSSLLYAALADRIPAEKFFKYLFSILAILLIGNWLAISETDSGLSYPLYFIIYEVASELLVIHAAHYFSQNFDTLQTKRLSPVIMSGAQIGAIFGGIFLATASHLVGVQNIILIWCLLLSLSLLIITIRHRQTGPSPYYRAGYKSNNKIEQSVSDIKEGLSLLKHSNLLRAMSFSLFFMVITFYVMSYSVNRIYTDTFTSEESLTAFFGVLSAVNSVAALFIQLFITNRLIRRFGAKKINLIFPITSIFSYLALLISFALPSAIMASFNKDALMIAVRNPVRNIFFSALPDNIQGRARATSIVVVMPIALSLTGALIWIMQSFENPVYLIALGISSALLYLYYCRQTNKAYVAEMVLHLKKKLFIPETDKRINTGTHDKELLEELSLSLTKKNTLTVDLARYITTYFPFNANQLILNNIDNTDKATKDEIIHLLGKNYTKELHFYLKSEINTTDIHLKHTILTTLFESRNTDSFSLITDSLNSDSPRLQAAGIYGCLIFDDENSYEKAISVWTELTECNHINSRLASLELIKCINTSNSDHTLILDNYKIIISNLLKSEQYRALKLTLINLQNWPEDKFDEISELIYETYKRTPPCIRLLCIKVCHLMSDYMQLLFMQEVLEDNSQLVRDQAVEKLITSESYSPTDLVKWITTYNKGSPRSQLSVLKVLQQHNTSKQLMKDIAIAKAKDAQLITKAIRIISVDPRKKSIPSLELLNYTLTDRRQQIIDLTLFAMHTLEDPNNIDVVRAGIKSHNPRHIANACEVLLNLNEREIADILIDIFEDLNHKKNEISYNEAKDFSCTLDILLWCSKRLDPWLQCCSLNAKDLYVQ